MLRRLWKPRRSWLQVLPEKRRVEFFSIWLWRKSTKTGIHQLSCIDRKGRNTWDYCSRYRFESRCSDDPFYTDIFRRCYSDELWGICNFCRWYSICGWGSKHSRRTYRVEVKRFTIFLTILVVCFRSLLFDSSSEDTWRHRSMLG